MSVRDQLARDIITYVMSNDILTQHGMAGLRKRLEAAIPDDVEVLYEGLLKRAGELLKVGKLADKQTLELDILVAGIEAYEAKKFPEFSNSVSSQNETSGENL